MSARLAQGNEARCVRHLREGYADAHVAGAKAQEPANTEHERDVQAGDAERRHRCANETALNPLQDRYQPAARGR